MTHFMKPHFLNADQKPALEASLDKLKIGDEKSRRIFVIALDYELTEFEKKSQGEAELPAQHSDEPLEKISEAANALSSMLQQLPGESFERLSKQLSDADAYSRQYSGDYLNALQDEIRRVSSACHGSVAGRDGGKPLSAERILLKAIANAYRECFEAEPLDDGGSFILLLGEVSAICDLGLSIEKASLKELLA